VTKTEAEFVEIIRPQTLKSWNCWRPQQMDNLFVVRKMLRPLLACLTNPCVGGRGGSTVDPV